MKQDNIIITPEVANDLKIKRVLANIKSKDVNNAFGKPASWICKLEKGEIKKLDLAIYNSLLEMYGHKEKGEELLNQLQILKLQYENLKQENDELRLFISKYIKIKIR